MYPKIPVLSLVSAALTLVPLIWYLRARNIAAVAIGIWLSVTNLIYAVDALVWVEDADIKAAAWCDIGSVFITGSRIALPAACLSICIHLEHLASLSSQISTPQAKRRRILFECLMSFGIPIVYIALHLIVQPHRFDLFYGYGCRPTTYPTIAAIFLVMIPPLLLTVVTIVYAGIAWRHFLVRGVQFYGKRGSVSSLTRNLYLRLVGMAVLEAVFSAVLICVIMWDILSPGLTPIGNMPRHLSEVLVWGSEAMTDHVQTVLEIEWSVTLVQSVVFFGLFACRTEVVCEGWELIRSFLRSLRRSNLSTTLFGKGTSSISATLPITVVDLSFIQSVSTLTPYDRWVDKSLPLTPSPSCPSSPVGDVGPTEDEIVISPFDPAMLPLESPSRSSAIASSHNSLASNADPSQLVFGPEAWPRTPTTIPVRPFRRPLSVGYVPERDREHWFDVPVNVPLPKSAAHTRSWTADFWSGLEKRQGIYVTVVRETR